VVSTSNQDQRYVEGPLVLDLSNITTQWIKQLGSNASKPVPKSRKTVQVKSLTASSFYMTLPFRMTSTDFRTNQNKSMGGGGYSNILHTAITYFHDIFTYLDPRGNPQKSNIRVRRRCAGGCGTVVWAAEIVCRWGTPNCVSVGLPSKCLRGFLSDCCSI